MIKAEIVADSINAAGNRITSMVVTFPRFILAELNTHRMFSRNSASSRAIPFEKMVKSVEENPFIPMAWQKDHKGMQGTKYFTEEESKTLRRDWLSCRNEVLAKAKELAEQGVTKQLCNRLLEPFMYHTVIITATDWENFFALRCPRYEIPNSRGFEGKQFRSRKNVINALDSHGGYPQSVSVAKTLPMVDWLLTNKGQAEIHMMTLAEAMWDAFNESVPIGLIAGQWHIPFGDQIDLDKLKDSMFYDHSVEDENEEADIERYKAMIATARCARISYTVVGEEGKPDNYVNDIKLHDRLAESGHWSPFEHCAKAMTEDQRGILGYSGNFKGWLQYRKFFTNENVV
jgi:thymidylate synthase ThyX